MPLLRKLGAVIGVMLVATSAMAQRPNYRPEDASIRCRSADECNALIGRKLWVTINNNEICATVRPSSGCRSIPINFGVTVEGYVPGKDRLDILGAYFQVRTEDGKVGFINTANAHLLTYTDPRPSIEAAKKRQVEKQAKAADKAKSDAAIIAATPKESFEKACILASAERLPKIPGIEVKSTKVLPPPAEHKPRPDQYMGVVEIAATAAGQQVTYSFVCGMGVNTPALVQPMGHR